MSTVDKNVILEALFALSGTTHGGKETGSDNELNLAQIFINPTQYIFKEESLHDFAGGSLTKLPVGIQNQLLDPTYDRDFTHTTDDKDFRRGGEPYKRPLGWQRFALKVLDKYPDGNTWLGTNEKRRHSVDGEWPVSYHGTTMDGVRGITKAHYKPGSRNVFGSGIYSTPNINVAIGYSTEFHSKNDGKTYKVLLQNRINPERRKICKRKDYWLIEIPEGTQPGKVKEIVEKSIRPYGILLKEVK